MYAQAFSFALAQRSYVKTFIFPTFTIAAVKSAFQRLRLLRYCLIVAAVNGSSSIALRKSKRDKWQRQKVIVMETALKGRKMNLLKFAVVPISKYRGKAQEQIKKDEESTIFITLYEDESEYTTWPLILRRQQGKDISLALDVYTERSEFFDFRLLLTDNNKNSLLQQMLGYGWAGIFRKVLVDSPYMWWPANLVQVSLFRALHEKEKRPRGGHTRLQFFLLIFISSFSYYLIPSYLFPSISCISIACLIWKDSIFAQQIGSGFYGLGIGSFGIDWSTVAAFLGSTH
ncbi:oligopeptide transporter 5-like [Cucumis melo var. makuwa]|uniref:Oligopeptide transporter 5-like n=1 Tax=Cucumis melo var. makuwa TaxID=1194695 RepID=A0A5A7UY40_CUCMM|nr:oligopeptide transporter 5-like [Cucumis melo var. makuwa]